MESSNNSNNNLRESLLTNEKESKPTTVTVEEADNESNAKNISNIENFISVTTSKPTDKEIVNFDELNILTKREVGERGNLTSDHMDSKIIPRKPINYGAKKTVAQGMMDIALLTSNANQLKNLVEYQRNATFYHLILIMIVLSLVLQISVGISLIFKGRFDSKGKNKAAAARVNNWVMSGVFMITVINVFIAVFSTGQPAAQNVVTQPN